MCNIYIYMNSLYIHIRIHPEPSQGSTGPLTRVHDGKQGVILPGQNGALAALGFARFQDKKCPFAQDTAVQSPVDAAASPAENVAGRCDAATHLLRIRWQNFPMSSISVHFEWWVVSIVILIHFANCSDIYHGTLQVVGLEGNHTHTDIYIYYSIT